MHRSHPDLTQIRPFEFVGSLLAIGAIAGLAYLALTRPAPTTPAGGPSGTVHVRAPAATQADATTSPTYSDVRYGRDIRPILSDRCFNCHGQDPETRAAGLRLDVREVAVAARDGVRAIVPGDAEASALWSRISATDPHVVMPPPEANKRPLGDAERGMLRAWIDDGAPYEAHWAFEAPVGHDPPAVSDEAWCRDEIDRFVLARLDTSGVSPSPEAAPATLFRRLFLDLTGLPPEPAELDDFLRDPSDDAYRSWVDRLLSEEPYRTRVAERLTVPWLDAARFADTIGIHTDNGRQAWLWRDWVLDAFRSNMPYDTFIIEQIAGDLIPEATDGQRIASGFNRNHVVTDEGGAIDEEYLIEYAADRTETTSAVFMGLTMGCARCHDHKYDPVSTEDYYKLFAYFNNNDEPGLYSQLPDPNRAHEPFISVPTAEQQARAATLEGLLEAIQAEIDHPPRDLAAARRELVAGLSSEDTWVIPTIVEATSAGGATMEPRDDGSVRAIGVNPETDRYELTIELAAARQGINAVLLEALYDPALPDGRVGRAPNGNAVMTDLEVGRVGGPPSVPSWAWADVTQANRAFHAADVLTGDRSHGWAINGHMETGERRLLVLLRDPMDLGAGERIRVRLGFESEWPQHAFGRVRVRLGAVQPPDGLMPASGAWYRVGPFAGSADELFAARFGPEAAITIDPDATFGADELTWSLFDQMQDGEAVSLADGAGVTYLARTLFAPAPMRLPVSLGSDDGFRLFVNGTEVASNDTQRGVQPDQDRAELPLVAGPNLVVLKIVNTGGAGGAYVRADQPESAWLGDLAVALLPRGVSTRTLDERLELAWGRSSASPMRSLYLQRDELRAERDGIDAAAPRALIMRDRAEPRQTYVLTRGQYDAPDPERPVQPGVPSVLGGIASDAPSNRLGLARWLVADENPLVARVAVNRAWMTIFGQGLLRTPEDFGLQGDWPTHPHLLDRLAVDFRDSGWDLRALLRRIVTSSTYRQSSTHREKLAETDPDNRLLARYPSRRLGAEQVRDQALHVGGLLVEQLGGPSVKPYQPTGLWDEVSMRQSNTRVFEPSDGDDLYRRSLYTYWKRAAPPPSMRAFDAPTREFCAIDRAVTNTPLQALVLWNDEQFVEAARALAQRTLAGHAGLDDATRLRTMFRRCTSAEPDDRELSLLRELLSSYRDRYRDAHDDAAGLVSVGASEVPESTDKPELAAWTMVASTVMNLYRTTTQE